MTDRERDELVQTALRRAADEVMARARVQPVPPDPIQLRPLHFEGLYAPFVEYGGAPIRPVRPFLLPAVRRVAAETLVKELQ